MDPDWEWASHDRREEGRRIPAGERFKLHPHSLAYFNFHTAGQNHHIFLSHT